jgi:hypothetical protein
VSQIVPAAGLGVRMAGGKSAQGAAPPKQLLELDGVPILFLTLRRLAGCARIERMIVAVRAADRADVEQRLRKEPYAAKASTVEGGESRHSVPTPCPPAERHWCTMPRPSSSWGASSACPMPPLKPAPPSSASPTDTVKQAEPGGHPTARA